MLTGKELGEAIKTAIEKKGVAKAAVARHFGVKPPSVSDWIKRGTIDKAKLPELFSYFSDVVDHEHWGVAQKSIQHWPKHVVEKPPTPYHARELVQQVCEIADRINDRGLVELIGIARYLAGIHPKHCQMLKSSG